MRAKTDSTNAPSGSGCAIADAASTTAAPMTAVLGRAGGELAHLARQLEHLEILLGPLILGAARKDPDFLRSVQGFDHIGQKAAGLAQFLMSLAAAVPDQWMVDPTRAAAAVTLADLSARLSLSPQREGAAAGCGDCDLF
jgi:hypothetical protein